MKDNLIGKELDETELGIIKDFKERGKLHADWFPLTTYDMIQSGYPKTEYGEMIARDFGGTDSEGRLLPADGMGAK